MLKKLKKMKIHKKLTAPVTQQMPQNRGKKTMTLLWIFLTATVSAWTCVPSAQAARHAPNPNTAPVLTVQGPPFAYPAAVYCQQRGQKNCIPPQTAQLGYVDLPQQPGVDVSQISPVRLQALRETAISLGAQGALAWRTQQMDATLEVQSVQLNRIYNFNALLINGNVQPPVLSQSNDNLTKDDEHTLRLADKTYRIISNAHFVTVPPTWRTYLTMAYSKPPLPDSTLLPQTPAETNAWNVFIKDGWAQGVTQANEIFSVNLNRLKRDYLGMVLYNKLLRQGMVTAPYVSEANLGVTGDDNEMRINDQVLRITAISKLRPDAVNEWKPVIPSKKN